MPDIGIEGWLTSLDLPVADIVKLYQGHGTHEQFHSEFKTDLGLERLPSGKFATNDLVLSLAMLAFNILRAIGQATLISPDSPVRRPAKRRRIRTVMQEIIGIAARVIQHARRLTLGLGGMLRSLCCVSAASSGAAPVLRLTLNPALFWWAHQYRQASAARPDDVKAVSMLVSTARFRSNFVRVGMLKSNSKLNPTQNVIPAGDGRVRGNVVKEGHGFRRKSAAYYLFIASLLCIIVIFIHGFGILHSTNSFSAFVMFLAFLISLVVPAFLIWYSKWVESRGWIS